MKVKGETHIFGHGTSSLFAKAYDCLKYRQKKKKKGINV